MAEGPVLVLAMREKHGPSALTACIVKNNAFLTQKEFFYESLFGGHILDRFLVHCCTIFLCCLDAEI